MRKFLVLALALSPALAQAQPVRPISRAVLAWHVRNVSMLPMLFQVTPGSPFGGSGSGTSFPVSDTIFKVCDDGDATKCVQVQASGITTANTLVPFSFSGTTAAPVIQIPVGAVATPSFVFTNATTSGMSSRTSTNIDFTSNANWILEMGTSGGGNNFVFSSAVAFGWAASTTATATLDTRLEREAAATVQMGTDVNGAAIAQTFKTCDGITGTDIAGCNHTEAAGRGTGIGAPGDYDIQTGKDLATGTTAQTLFDRHFYRGKAKALTESSATTFVTFNIPTSLTAVGGTVRYCLHATDATDVQERCGEEDFACVNKAGTVTPSTPNLIGTEATAITSGTLTLTITMVNSGTTCSMQANAASSLTQTILDIRYSVEMHGSGTVTP